MQVDISLKMQKNLKNIHRVPNATPLYRPSTFAVLLTKLITEGVERSKWPMAMLGSFHAIGLGGSFGRGQKLLHLPRFVLQETGTQNQVRTKMIRYLTYEEAS